MPLLDIKNLNIKYVMKDREVLACDAVNLTVDEQDSIGIVGESGSGKSTLAMGILDLLPKKISRIEGEMNFMGRNLVGLDEKGYSEIRWKNLSAVFQKSMNGMSPVHRVGKQIASIYRVHKPDATNAECREMAVGLFDKVNLSERVYDLYPYELSGGMMQRVSIAISLMFHPALVILDEATTALDVVTEGQILREIVHLQETEQMTRIMITHDMAVVASSCEKVAIMYAGRIMESGKTEDVLMNPKHPYTQGLMRSFPSFWGEKSSLRGIPGSLPDLSKPIPGCVFAPRCQYANERCYIERPKDTQLESGWNVACFLVEEKEIV